MRLESEQIWKLVNGKSRKRTTIQELIDEELNSGMEACITGYKCEKCGGTECVKVLEPISNERHRLLILYTNPYNLHGGNEDAERDKVQFENWQNPIKFAGINRSVHLRG